MNWLGALLLVGAGAVGAAVVLDARQKKVVNILQNQISVLQSNINRLDEQIRAMNVLREGDLNQINAQIQSLVSEIQNLKNQISANPELLQQLETLEKKMAEMIRKKKEILNG